ncbi:MAG: hypothetical protein RL150_93 [Candidatus Parcubacteria bacterium]|jgi:hypothetical protein
MRVFVSTYDVGLGYTSQQVAIPGAHDFHCQSGWLVVTFNLQADAHPRITSLQVEPMRPHGFRELEIEDDLAKFILDGVDALMKLRGELASLFHQPV